MQNLSNIGSMIKEKRMMHHMTIMELAERANLHRNTVQKIEKGLDMRLSTLLTIGDILNFDIHFIVSNASDKIVLEQEVYDMDTLPKGVISDTRDMQWG